MSLDRIWKIRRRASCFRGLIGDRLLRGGPTRTTCRLIGLLRQRCSDVYVWLHICRWRGIISLCRIFNPLNVKKVQLWLKVHKEMGENATEREEGREKTVPKIMKDTQDTIPYLAAEGDEHTKYEDFSEVVIDPTLRTWLFHFCALLAQHSQVSEPVPSMEEGRVGFTRWRAQPA